ncbi:MAG: DUF6629 family protein [Gammaproteobacteria bacterium]
MCFSATASFTAGTLLFAVGVATLGTAKTRAERPFAMIPLLFGIQQLIEGVIWLTFSHDAPLLKQTMTYLYSGFSHVLWPMYVPFAMAILEAVPWRRTAIFAFEAAGVPVGLYLLYVLVTRPLVAEVVGSHIVYVSPHFYQMPVMVAYLAATCVSCFFSSHGFVKLFGVLALLSFIAAYLVHITALISIWCFFAAILSLLIYLHLRFRHLGGFPKAPAFRSANIPGTATSNGPR